MDSLAAAPGTGPATSPLPVLRKPRPAAKFQDLPTDRTLVMGILNVTPDSFSDGGEHATRGHRRSPPGCGCSTPGRTSSTSAANPPARVPTAVSVDEEQRRVLPVIEALVKAGALVSIDTTHAATAAAALDAGAAIINDVSGPDHGTGDGRTGGPHQGALHPDAPPRRRQHHGLPDRLPATWPRTSSAELAGVRDKLYAAGVAPEQIIVDPGLGFAKNEAQNWELLRAPGRPAGAGPQGPGGRLPQALPRHAC